MKSLISKGTTLILIMVAFAFLPLNAEAQWDAQSWEDRSDETFDQFDSGNSTTWIVIGAGVGLATAAVVYTLKKRRDAKKEDVQKTEEDESTSALHFPSPEASRLQQFAETQRRLPVDVRVGIHPESRNPAIGLSVRF